MANETVASTWTKNMLSESLVGPLEAHKADKLVLFNLFNKDNIDGIPSLSRDYVVETDLGPGAAVAETADITANTAMALGTTVTVTPTEGAVDKATISTRAMKKQMPGFTGANVHDALMSMDLATVTRILASPARRQLAMIREKIEDDCANLLASLTSTVGTSGATLSIADLLGAQYLLRTLNPHHEEWAYFLNPNQYRDAQIAFGGASGSAAAAWFNQGDVSFLNHTPDAARNGYQGTVMGLPIYVGNHDLRTTANTGADVIGALVCVGQGTPEQQKGAFVYVEGDAMRYDLDRDPSARNAELIAIQEYAVALLDDNQGVGIVTDAPA